jgi:hypothetical protein
VSERVPHEGVLKLLRLLADRLEDHLEGDELALETLGDTLEDEDFSGDEIQAAIAAVRTLAGVGPAAGWVAGSPGVKASRVLSHEERESLSTEAWGYLLGLRQGGALDPEQFERVLDLLTGSGVRPVSEELAREVASRVAMEHDDAGNAGEAGHGDIEVAH